MPDHSIVGLDVGGTKILAQAVDPVAPTIALAEHRVPTPAGGPALVDAIEAVVRRIDDTVVRAGREPLSAVGVGVPGLVTVDGVLRTAPNLPGVTDLAVRAELEDRLDVPVVVDNDANCAGWAEANLGAGAGADQAVLVTLGTGIGGALVVDGVLVHGAVGFAGEPGHMVVDPAGPVCPCGRRGCWERFASGSGLEHLARQRIEGGGGAAILERAGGDPAEIRGEHVTGAARAGDGEAVAVLEDFAGWIALGLANLVNLLDPSVLIIGGGVADEADLLLEPVRRAFAAEVLGVAARPGLRVEVAALGSHAGALGAALLATAAVGALAGP